MNDCFKIKCKQIIQMPKEGESVKFKYYERKIKSPFMIYTDFESILVFQKIMKSKIQMNLIQKKYIKNMLLAVMAIN